jgi:hypothetical protein
LRCSQWRRAILKDIPVIVITARDLDTPNESLISRL